VSITFPVPESEFADLYCYAYAAAFEKALDLNTLIEDLTGAAHEAIEQAAAEAARASALASLDREMAAMAETQRLHSENSRLRQSRVKTAVVTGIICFFGGLAVGAGGIALLQRVG
jgi:hypothetical protein